MSILLAIKTRLHSAKLRVRQSLESGGILWGTSRKACTRSFCRAGAAIPAPSSRGSCTRCLFLICTVRLGSHPRFNVEFRLLAVRFASSNVEQDGAGDSHALLAMQSGYISGRQLDNEPRAPLLAPSFELASALSSSRLHHLLKGCLASKDLQAGKRVHALVVTSGLESDNLLASQLIRMYASHGALGTACQVFSKLHAPNDYCWAAIIAAHSQHGQGAKAIYLYHQMQRSGIKANEYMFVPALRACASIFDLDSGRIVHADAIKAGFSSNVFVGNTLVDMYSQCGYVDEARKIFDGLRQRNMVSWSAMIAGYAHHGLGIQALQLFRKMQDERIVPNTVTFLSALKACSSTAALDEGRKIHRQILELELQEDLSIGNSLVYMYSKCGDVSEARRIFDRLKQHDVVTCTAMIAGYAQHGLGAQALEVFKDMQEHGIVPNAMTFVSVLNSCASIAVLDKGKEVHRQILDRGLKKDPFVNNALIDMYAKCGDIKQARRVFDGLKWPSQVAWNAMIGGYVQHGLHELALQLFGMMQEQGVVPDKLTYVSALKACASVAASRQSKEIHRQISDRGLEGDVFVANALIDTYAKVGELEEARQVFDGLKHQNVVSWTTMIAAYTQLGLGEQALQLFKEMQVQGLVPNSVTFLSVLKACGSIAALCRGKEIHRQIVNVGLQEDLLLGSTLIDMYAKCGDIEEARRTFDALNHHCLVSWTAMIAGYAQHGLGKEALVLYERMQAEGVIPNWITISSLLCACSRAGLVDDGWKVFHAMSEQFGITPNIEHYGCMVDILGRAGQLAESEQFIKKMPIPPDDVVWLAMLGACRRHKSVEYGRWAFESAVALDPKNSAAYVLLANIYAAHGRWEEQVEIRRRMLSEGITKTPGRTWIEVATQVHTFVAGDKEHPQRRDINAKLRHCVETLKKKYGYTPDLGCVVEDITDGEKEEALAAHSEKLALAYGLLCTPPGTTLRYNKNLRICQDCHTMTKLISKLEQREIIARDKSRFHYFKDGVCSCGDYW